MSDYKPTGPLDAIAAQIAGFFGSDPTWTSLATGPLPAIRATLKAGTPIPRQPAVDHIEDFQVPVSGGEEILVRLYRPVAKPHAIIVWVHGGGFVLGSVEESDGFTRAFAQRTGCAVVSVDYRLAPEYVFPTQVDDVLAAARWVLERRTELAGGDVPVVIGGDSAGANLATVVTRKLHEATPGTVAANLLAYPCTDNAEAASLKRFDSPFLTLSDTTVFLNAYQPDPAGRKNPDFAPLYATNLGVLPPTLIITAEHDILTEQGEAYGQKLKDAGVKVEIKRHPGMIHGFATIDAFFAGPAGTAMQQMSDFIKAV